MIDNKTSRLELPLPDVDNFLEDDVARLKAAFEILDKAALVGDDNTVPLANLPENLALLGSDGKLPIEMIPALAITDTFPVNSEAEMLALSAERGDIAIRSDVSKSFILAAEPASDLNNWVALTNDVLIQLAQPDGYLNIGGLDKQYGNIWNAREQWRRQMADAGLNLVSGSFEQGATVSTATDAVWFQAGGQCYTWGGSLPKSVPAGSTPESAGGISTGAWNNVGSATLRGVLSTPGTAKTAITDFAQMGPYLNIAQYGARTDKTQCLLDMVSSVNNDLDWKHGFGVSASKLRIDPGVYTSEADLEFTKAITLLAYGVQLRFVGNTGLIINPSGNFTSIIKGLSLFHDSGVATKPLIEIKKAFHSLIENVSTDGNGANRRYGMWLASVTGWGNTLLKPRCYNSLIGLRLGNNTDATHTSVIGATIEHNKLVGALICNPYGGGFKDSSVEWNEGKYGLAVTSYTNGSDDPAAQYTIQGIYGLNNGANYPGEAIGLAMGIDIDETEGFDDAGLIDSAAMGRGWSVSDCMFLSNNTKYGAVIRGFTGGSIRNSQLKGTAYDLEIRGTAAPEIYETRNNSTGTLNVNDQTTNGAHLLSAVYVSASGSDTNDGKSSSAPVLNFLTALRRVSADGTIYVVSGTVPATNIGIQRNVHIDIASSCTLSLNGVTTTNNVTFTGSGTLLFPAAAGISVASQTGNVVITIGDGLTVTMSNADQQICIVSSGNGSSALTINIGTLAALTGVTASNRFFINASKCIVELNFTNQTISPALLFFRLDAGHVVVRSQWTTGFGSPTITNNGRLIVQ